MLLALSRAGPALIPFYIPRSHFSFARAVVAAALRAPSRSNKMDASSVAAAALAVAIEDSRTAALRKVMLDRERATMVAEDAHSYLAQRHFSYSLQEHLPVTYDREPTWRNAYVAQLNVLLHVRDVMRASLTQMRAGNNGFARTLLAWEVGGPDDEDAERGSAEMDTVEAGGEVAGEYPLTGLPQFY